MTLFGDGESLFDVILTEREAIEKVTGKEKYEIIKSNCTEEYVEYNLAKYEKSGIRLISVFDGEYPERLRHSEGSPYMLYCRGDTGLLDAEDTIAVCGTRSCTTYGRRVAEDFVNAFSLAGMVTVCGASEGIEAAALKKAVKCGGRAIMVLPFGCDAMIQGSENSITEQIAREGLMVSEFSFGAGYGSFMYAAAKRLIAILSDGVVLIEAGERSGALGICDAAIEYNKELFVVPGGINSTASAGANMLIKTMPECMVTSSADIIERMHVKYVPVFPEKEEERDVGNMSEEEKKVMELVSAEEKSLNELVAESGMETSELFSVLSCMEMLGYIEKTPHGRYIAKGRGRK